jgi:hypothetical protein
VNVSDSRVFDNIKLLPLIVAVSPVGELPIKRVAVLPDTV